MAGTKGIFRSLKEAVLKGMGHGKDRLHGFADNIDDHLDNVVRQVRDKDNFDPPPALTGNSTNRVDRTTTELLYRSDNRPPADIFRDGFEVRDPNNNNYDDFVRWNTPSNFISTTRDPDLYQRWGSDYRYTIDAPGGIDADATIPNNPFGPTSQAPEAEVSFQGGVTPEQISGAHPVKPDGTLGDWIPNPGYGGK
ncbi:hypothetical protein [Microbacterium sp. EST19A]|uniref:scabin-related ADP-ribosyltransferase n=1 Tax=Microbacterium sp. EST19A TaxID=2862681 RepID=UPI001CBC0554|nr:hypothetical protein [Microbacterium sp. EST19A]